ERAEAGHRAVLPDEGEQVFGLVVRVAGDLAAGVDPARGAFLSAERAEVDHVPAGVEEGVLAVVGPLRTADDVARVVERPRRGEVGAERAKLGDLAVGPEEGLSAAVVVVAGDLRRGVDREGGARRAAESAEVAHGVA